MASNISLGVWEMVGGRETVRCRCFSFRTLKGNQVREPASPRSTLVSNPWVVIWHKTDLQVKLIPPKEKRTIPMCYQYLGLMRPHITLVVDSISYITVITPPNFG